MKRPQFKPYIADEDNMAEFTIKAIVLGGIFGIIFGAATVYLGLKVGLTTSASIPIAVLSVAIFKRFGKSTILENNIVQTIGSAGESIAGGVVFTLPALLFLEGGESYFRYGQILVLSLCGGILGVLFMVPLRRSLIVKEHGNLPYPEGTACADVLIAGEKGGNLAAKVFYGLGIAFLYKFLMSILGLWKDIPEYIFGKKSVLPNASIGAEITPELLGMGYIVGPRIAGVLVAGGVLSYLVLIPAIAFFGEAIQAVIPPGTMPIGEMGSGEIRNFYIRYIGAGAVTFGGLITLVKTLPTIFSAFRDSLKSIRNQGDEVVLVTRTQRDLPLWYVMAGAAVMALVIPVLAGPLNLPLNFLSGILIVIFSFFFVTVSSRIVGIVGTSSSPISGMAIATLMATCLIFLAMGWSGDAYGPMALCIGSIVCIASANAGATSQDLKTGFILGATPSRQQYGLMIGAAVSVISIGFTMMMLRDTVGIGDITPEHPRALPAPQANLMVTVIKGLLSNNLPWQLVLIGMGISLVVELCGINSLAFAVGVYLPLSSTSPIWIGGLIKWIVDKRKGTTAQESDAGSGALFSSGLIAGGSLTGILIAALIGANWLDSVNMPAIIASQGTTADLIAIIAFGVLGLILYRFATKD